VGHLVMLVDLDLPFSFRVCRYSDAIDGMKSNSDFLWQAAASEGLVCANLIRGLRAAGMAVSYRQRLPRSFATLNNVPLFFRRLMARRL
jgi:hypothetical protein